jgi:hypothetical protein
MHFAVLIVIAVILFIISIIPTPISNNYRWLPLVFLPFGIGLLQLVYVIPVSLWLKQQGRFGLMKGVIIGAVITALLNGGCWLLLSSTSF